MKSVGTSVVFSHTGNGTIFSSTLFFLFNFGIKQLIIDFIIIYVLDLYTASKNSSNIYGFVAYVKGKNLS